MSLCIEQQFELAEGCIFEKYRVAKPSEAHVEEVCAGGPVMNCWSPQQRRLTLHGLPLGIANLLDNIGNSLEVLQDHMYSHSRVVRLAMPNLS